MCIHQVTISLLKNKFQGQKVKTKWGVETSPWTLILKGKASNLIQAALWIASPLKNLR